MIALITIIILLACVILAFFILVQNPKESGGGLSGTFGSMSSAVMGVKQSTDVMEKGTWVLISIIAGLSLISVMFFQKPQNVAPAGKSVQQTSAPVKGK